MRKTVIMALLILGIGHANAQTGILKDPVSFKLKNGLTVIVAENLSADKVFSTLTIDANPVSAHKAGVKELLTLLLNENAGKTATRLSFNENGGNLAATPANFESALASLSATLRRTAIAQTSVDALKLKLIVSVKAKDLNYPDAVTAEAIQALTVNDVRNFYIDHINPTRAYLTIAGQITIDDAKDLVKKSFGNWTTDSSTDAI